MSRADRRRYTRCTNRQHFFHIHGLPFAKLSTLSPEVIHNLSQHFPLIFHLSPKLSPLSTFYSPVDNPPVQKHLFCELIRILRFSAISPLSLLTFSAVSFLPFLRFSDSPDVFCRRIVVKQFLLFPSFAL